MIFGRSDFCKYVPTDMNWAPTLPGGYALVRIFVGICPEAEYNYSVVISGNDDVSCQVWFKTYEKAIMTFNSIKYIQSSADLEVFRNRSVDGIRIDNNEWPHDLPISRDEREQYLPVR